MNNHPVWKQILLILIILPIVGGLIGYVFMGGRLSEQQTWETLGSPPSPAKLIISSSPSIIVSSENDNYYRYGYSDGWKLILEVPIDLTKNFFENEVLCNHIYPRELIGIVDTAEICSYYGLGYDYTRISIIHDGSVWKWEEQNGGEGSNLGSYFYIVAWSFGFFIIGLILTPIIIIFNQIPKKDRLSDDT